MRFLMQSVGLFYSVVTIFNRICTCNSVVATCQYYHALFSGIQFESNVAVSNSGVQICLQV